MSIKLNFDKKRNDYYKKHAIPFWDCVYYENNTPFALPMLNLQTAYISAKKDFEKMSRYGTEYFQFSSVVNEEYDKYVENVIVPYLKDINEFNKETVEYERKNYAEIFSKFHFTDYTMFVKLLEESHYPMSFKTLMLNEFLTQTYKQNYVDGKLVNECHKRNLRKSLRGIMQLDNYALDYIFANADKYDNFKNLYFDSLRHSKAEIVKFQTTLYNKTKNTRVARNDVNNMDILSPETFNKGKWIKFSQNKKDPENFEQTAQNLSTLFKGTISCLDHNAWFYLTTDPVYVFVDNQNNPKLVVAGDNKKIFEFHGMGENQTIEQEYFEVAKDFLKKNSRVPQADLFLKVVEANEKLFKFNKQIENGTFKERQMKDFSDTLDFVDKTHLNDAEGKNAYVKKTISLLPKIEPMVTRFLKQIDSQENTENKTEFNQ